MTIKDLSIGESARVDTPMGDPMELRIHGYELTLRVARSQRDRASGLQR